MENIIEKPLMKLVFKKKSKNREFSVDDLKLFYLNGLDSWAKAYPKIIEERTEMSRKLQSFSVEESTNFAVFIFDIKAIIGVASPIEQHFWSKRTHEAFSKDEFLYFEFIDGFSNSIVAHILQAHLLKSLDTNDFLPHPEMFVTLDH